MPNFGHHTHWRHTLYHTHSYIEPCRLSLSASAAPPRPFFPLTKSLLLTHETRPPSHRMTRFRSLARFPDIYGYQSSFVFAPAPFRRHRRRRLLTRSVLISQPPPVRTDPEQKEYVLSKRKIHHGGKKGRQYIPKKQHHRPCPIPPPPPPNNPANPSNPNPPGTPSPPISGGSILNGINHADDELCPPGPPNTPPP